MVGWGLRPLPPIRPIMANRRLLDYDPVTKTTQWFHYDDATGAMSLETEQDVSAIIEANKAHFNQTDERTAWKGDVHRVAQIPMSLYHELAKVSNNFKDQRVVRKFLNDSDNRVFRTRPGRV